jgi:hypothetical protein
MADNANQKIDKKPAVRALFRELLEKTGATDELLAKRMFQGLNATVVLRETQYANREVLIDFKERREMSKLVGQVKGVVVDHVEVDAGPGLSELLEESFRG